MSYLFGLTGFLRSETLLLNSILVYDTVKEKIIQSHLPKARDNRKIF